MTKESQENTVANGQLAASVNLHAHIDAGMDSNGLAAGAIARLEHQLRQRDGEYNAQHKTLTDEHHTANRDLGKFALGRTVEGKDIPAELTKIAKAVAALGFEVQVRLSPELRVVGPHYEPENGGVHHPEGKVLVTEHYGLSLYDAERKRKLETAVSENLVVRISADYTQEREGNAEEQAASDKVTELHKKLEQVTTARFENRKQMQDMPYFERQIKARVSERIAGSNPAAKVLMDATNEFVADILAGGDGQLKLSE